jgi:hypothetical protein
MKAPLTQNETDAPGLELEDKREQVDTAESSVTVDADEIQYEDDDELKDRVLDSSNTTTESRQTENSIEVEHEDEINYEDDKVDEEKQLGGTTPLALPQIMSSSNGKRSRGDVESDEVMIMRSNGTYWALHPKRQRR